MSFNWLCITCLFLITTISANKYLDSNVIVVELHDAENTDSILSAIKQTQVIHATRLGTISLFSADMNNREFTASIASRLHAKDKVYINRIPDIPIRNGWSRRKRSLEDFDLESYNTYDSIYEYLEEFAAANSHICTLEEIGRTFEDRAIKVVKISGTRRGPKARVFIDGAQHAREWISPAVLVYMINKLVTDYEEGDEWTVSLLDKYEFSIVPIVNPDGYAYTYDNSRARFWRKNKKNITSVVHCLGVDLNRNWGFHWSGKGGSEHKCSELYYGAHEFSEEETQALSNYILQYKGTWHSYFSFHSFGQMILFPWSHTDSRGPDYDKHRRAGHQLAAGIKAISNSTYTCGSVGGILYEASGSSESWAYAEAGVPYSYTVELPDLYTFVISPEKIAPTVAEFINGFKYYFRHIESEDPDLYSSLIRNVTQTSELSLPDIVLSNTTDQISTETVEMMDTGYITISTRLRLWLSKTQSQSTSTSTPTTTDSSTVSAQVTATNSSPTSAHTSTKSSSTTGKSAESKTTAAYPNSRHCDKNCQNHKESHKRHGHVENSARTTSATHFYKSVVLLWSYFLMSSYCMS